MQRFLYTINHFALIFILLFIYFINIHSYFTASFLNDTNKNGQSKFDSSISKIKCFLSVDQYRFFSPDIMDGFVLLLRTKKPKTGNSWVPVRFSSYEMVNRMHGFYYNFYCEKEARDCLAHSLSTYFLSQDSTLNNLHFTFYRYQLPIMKEYVQGKRPGLEKVYETRFEVSPQ